MKRIVLYTIALTIVALIASSCANTYRSKGRPPEILQEDTYDFEEADLDDGPLCGCEDEGNVYHIRFVHNTYNIK